MRNHLQPGRHDGGGIDGIAGEEERHGQDLTVLIPAYNEGAMVEETIASVAAARYPRERLQIIAIDDGSTDDTWHHIRHAALRFPGLVAPVRLPANQGKRSALAEGFRRCGNTLIGLRDFTALHNIPERRKDTRHDRDEAGHTQLQFDKKAFGGQLHGAAQSIAAIPGLAEDDTDKQREAFEEASRKLQHTFAPIADLYTAYLMDGSIRPADYGRLLSHHTFESCAR